MPGAVRHQDDGRENSRRQKYLAEDTAQPDPRLRWRVRHRVQQRGEGRRLCGESAARSVAQTVGRVARKQLVVSGFQPVKEKESFPVFARDSIAPPQHGVDRTVGQQPLAPLCDARQGGYAVARLRPRCFYGVEHDTRAILWSGFRLGPHIIDSGEELRVERSVGSTSFQVGFESAAAAFWMPVMM